MLTYNIINENESITVLPEGELAYHHVCHELEGIVSGCMGPGMRVSLNMGKVSFLDSAGVGFLLQIKKTAEMRHGSFEMHNLRKNVKMILDRLTLNEFLNVAKDDPFFPDDRIYDGQFYPRSAGRRHSRVAAR